MGQFGKESLTSLVVQRALESCEGVTSKCQTLAESYGVSPYPRRSVQLAKALLEMLCCSYKCVTSSLPAVSYKNECYFLKYVYKRKYK